MPTPVPCNQLYYDANTEPIATCACGKYAYTACGRCRHYRCPQCQPPGRQTCAGCLADAAREAAIASRQATQLRDRRLAAAAHTTDPIERLLQVAMLLAEVRRYSGEAADEVYPLLLRACPDLTYDRDLMWYWEPGTHEEMSAVQEPVPWDSGQVATWVTERAAEQDINPDTTIVVGRRLISRTVHGWHLQAGSTVRSTGGHTHAAYVLQPGRVIHTDGLTVPHRGTLTIRTLEPAGLNLRALARLGHLLRLPPLTA